MMLAYLSIFSFSINQHQPKVHYPSGAVLTIIDGFGESAWPEGNGILHSKMPFLSSLKSKYPYQSLVASQQPVGLVSKEPGSSAVGHQTLGLGRTTPSYYQILERSLNYNSPDSMVNNKVLRDGLHNAKRAHFVGLCTDEGIFSHPKFLPPMFEAAILENVSEVYVHCILTTLIDKPSKYLNDIEDLFPKSINEYKSHLDLAQRDKAHVNTTFKLAAVYSGETAMDKLQNWTATQVAYDAMVDFNKIAKLPKNQAIDFLDSLNQFVPIFNPICLYDDANGNEFDCQKSIMQENDPVVFFHFREDSSYQLAKALIEGLPKSQKNPHLKVLPLILYHPSLASETRTIIPAVNYPNSLGSWISQKGFKQLRVAEEYKRSHATTFFSGGVLQPIFEGEERKIDFGSVSEAVADLFPEMNATLVANAAVEGINKKKEKVGNIKIRKRQTSDKSSIALHFNEKDESDNYYKFIFVNFANVDATGHSGNETAVRIACEIVDKKIQEIYNACAQNDFALFIASDHGNGDEMLNLDGRPNLFHSINNVPFIAIYNTSWSKDQSAQYDDYVLEASSKNFNIGQVPFIGNVAPSILYTLGIEIPPEMEPPIISRKIISNYKEDSQNIEINNQVLLLKPNNDQIFPLSTMSISIQNILIFIGIILGIIISILALFIYRFRKTKRENCFLPLPMIQQY